jgi:hypothetical protein
VRGENKRTKPQRFRYDGNSGVYDSGGPGNQQGSPGYEVLDFKKARGSSMKLWLVVAVVLCVPLCASAQTASKSCDDVKADIAKKLDAKGVTGYTLTIEDKGKETGGKIVGNCGGGTKSIVYEKATPAPQPEPKPKPKPASASQPK